ncbi:MAG TPA: PhoX family phosphatase [Stackebrandtia sp.]|uniref:PhoX family protein n=1 Tax=Stackebrandtia sp. TaxID=2023065 RepID=UPI002D5722A5|nr:PhoX family phosphatase [Stackebrandtia sp.]HZE40610.1 PhoX family phosphatase [Stackebrandtia sp.]
MKSSRRLLPLLNTGKRHGNRSYMTCRYKCGNACDHPVENPSDNTYFGDLVASRRGLLRAGGVGALVIGAGVAGVATAQTALADGTHHHGHRPSGELSFTPVTPNNDDKVTVPHGYKQSVVIEWGTPLLPGVPDFDIDKQTAKAQRGQFGYNNDYVGLIPLDHSGHRALMVVNHEYTDEVLMFRDYTDGDHATIEQLEIAMAAHGMTVVEVVRDKHSGQWRTIMDAKRRFSGHNRRVHLRTEFAFTGPAKGDKLLVTEADPHGTTPIGTMNNCSGGLTPWGTVLSGEENIDQYFTGGDGVPEDQKPFLSRYGIDVKEHHKPENRRFDRADERFDLTKHNNEANRFGWVIEVDPQDPHSTPRKHTALGRFKHESANPIIADNGHAVVYMGDDTAFEYIYKFVSDRKYREGDRRHNLRLLESGTLYVSKLSFTSADEIDGSGKLPSDGEFNGKGEWIPLVRGDESLVDGMSVAEVLVHTRFAADKVGATKMDRPEDIEPNKVTGKIYAALTNNVTRGTSGFAADEANPRNTNKSGHVIEITERGGDHCSTRFGWDLLLVCGDPDDASTFFAGFDKSKVSPISCPDNVAFDSSGKNLWISTDGAPEVIGSNDAMHVVPLSGPERGYLRQFLSLPVGAETCGPFVAEDNKTVFAAVQHPGEVDGATVDKPASRWPHGDYGKPAVICVWRPDGEDVGK